MKLERSSLPNSRYLFFELEISQALKSWEQYILAIDSLLEGQVNHYLAHEHIVLKGVDDSHFKVGREIIGPPLALEALDSAMRIEDYRARVILKMNAPNEDKKDLSQLLTLIAAVRNDIEGLDLHRWEYWIPLGPGSSENPFFIFYPSAAIFVP